MITDWLEYLRTPDPVWRPRAFDRVTVSSGAVPIVSLLGTCWSEYDSGPNLWHLANATVQVLGRGGSFGLWSCRSLGFRAEIEVRA